MPNSDGSAEPSEGAGSPAPSSPEVPPAIANPAWRNPVWSNVPDASWNDVTWQLRNSIRNANDLARLIALRPQEIRAIDSLAGLFRFSVTPYYFSLIDPDDPGDPIRRMIIPSIEEQRSIGRGEIDPLGEVSDQVAPGLTHRYPDRVLLVVTSFCTSYCRFCIRKRNWRTSDAARTRDEIDAAVGYIRSHSEIRDVLISGGDPLTLPPHQLEYILASVRRIPHVEIIRVGSREPVMLPMRITEALASMLGRYSPLWLNTHFNHPREITPEAARAVERVLRAGVPVNNQSVLLRGVNDSVKTMRALVQGLVRIKVRPYYVYHCDNVLGTAHLRTSVRRGLEIMEGLRGHTTGFAVPTYVVDAPQGGGKIPLMPNYLVSQGEHGMVLRNFEGVLVSVEDAPGAPADRRLPAPGLVEKRASGFRRSKAFARAEPQSVSALLAGHGRRLVPGGLKHYDRREKDRAPGGAKAREGQAARALKPRLVRARASATRRDRP